MERERAFITVVKILKKDSVALMGHKKIFVYFNFALGL